MNFAQAVNNGEKCEHWGYLHGGCVSHSLLHHSGCGLGDDASGGLAFNRQMMALGGGGPSTCTRCQKEDTHTHTQQPSDTIREHQNEAMMKGGAELTCFQGCNLRVGTVCDSLLLPRISLVVALGCIGCGGELHRLLLGHVHALVADLLGTEPLVRLKRRLGRCIVLETQTPGSSSAQGRLQGTSRRTEKTETLHMSS